MNNQMHPEPSTKHDSLIGVSVPAVIKTASPTALVIKFELPEGSRMVKLKRHLNEKKQNQVGRRSRNARRSIVRFLSHHRWAGKSKAQSSDGHKSLESAQTAADWDLLPVS
jgi:hypothetical protein